MCVTWMVYACGVCMVVCMVCVWERWEYERGCVGWACVLCG